MDANLEEPLGAQPATQHTPRVAILGGSFNPPHRGHERLCRTLLAESDVGEVWLVPVAVHPGGKALAPFAERVAMCRLMAATIGPAVSVCDLEGRMAPPVKTHQLIVALAALHPTRQFTLALGADLAPHVGRWPGWAEVERLAPPRVFARFAPDAPPDSPLEEAPWSSTEARRRLKTGESVSSLLAPEVERHLRARRLYADPTTGASE